MLDERVYEIVKLKIEEVLKLKGFGLVAISFREYKHNFGIYCQATTPNLVDASKASIVRIHEETQVALVLGLQEFKNKFQIEFDVKSVPKKLDIKGDPYSAVFDYFITYRQRLD